MTLKEILDHEETYNFDINKDGSIGDVVAEVITNDGNGHGLYKTVSGDYVIDESGLSVGSSTKDPVVLQRNQKLAVVVHRRLVTTNLHKHQRALYR